MKHAYVVTDSIPGMHGGLPNVRDHDLSIYLKAQGDAMALGGYEVRRNDVSHQDHLAAEHTTTYSESRSPRATRRTPSSGTAPAAALQFFVDCEHGDDGADGRSAQRPFLTIARAQNATRSAAGAATVYLAPGVCQLVGNGSTVSAAAELYRPWVVNAADSGTSFEALDSAAPAALG